MNIIPSVSLFILLSITQAEAKSKSCTSNGGICVPKTTTSSQNDCDKMSFKCRSGDTCCKMPTTSDEKKITSNKPQNLSHSDRRTCPKKHGPCWREGGRCFAKPCNFCQIGTVDCLCKGASCTCCLGEKKRCNTLPACKFQGGVCISKRFALSCATGNVIDGLCESKKCSCCLIERNCKCGRANKNRIIGGQEVSPPHKYPWMAGLTGYTGQFYCGATLINDRYLLTAAHCVDHSSKIKVALGAHKELSNPNAKPGVTQVLAVEKTIIHENYNAKTNDEDIALIKLKEPLDLSLYEEIQPVCLPTNPDETYEGQDGIVAGWGQTEYYDYGSFPGVLYEVTVPILSTECEANFTMYDITENMLCAGALKGGKDSCIGDSGGPLVVKNGNTYTLVGIVSFGEGCAVPNKPGVYTRVTQYLKWIMRHTRDANYCS